MTTFICINDETYLTDTDKQIAAARKALMVAGLESAPVWAGHPDCPDSYRNGDVLWALTAADLATSIARGCYQRDLAAGRANLSGSDLKGKAKLWGAAYARSRRAFMARAEAAGVEALIEGGTSKTGPRRIVGWRAA